MIVDNFPDREITTNNKQYLYFGGTSYLGMSTHPVFQNTLTNSIKKWGTSYGSSRNSNIKLSVYKNFETLFAKQIGSEDSISVSSGTLAGKLVLDCLSKSKTTFYHYPKTHPAILNCKSLPLFINGSLHSNLLNNIKEDIAVSVDAILSLDVEATSFEFLDKISQQKRITIIIDESHSLGIVGKYGEGIFGAISNENICRKIMISSLGKALGISGGIIAADRNFIAEIKNESIFISSSSANPAYLETYLLSQNLYALQGKKLNENLEFLFNDLDLGSKYKYNKNYPVIYSLENNIYDSLFDEGIVITNFKYPTYKNEMNRIVITANHSFEDLKKLKLALKNLFLEQIKD